MVIAPDAREIIEKLEERNAALERELKILREELALLRQHVFGRRTERIEPGQLGLFADGELEEGRSEAAGELTSPLDSGRGATALGSRGMG